MRIFLVAALTALAVSAHGQTEPAIPPGADLESYRVVDKPLTVGDMADMSLRPFRLRKSWTGFVWNAESRRFWFETLQASTVVLVNPKGEMVYQESTGGRLVNISCGNLVEVPFDEVYEPLTVAEETQVDEEPEKETVMAPGLERCLHFLRYWKWMPARGEKELTEETCWEEIRRRRGVEMKRLQSKSARKNTTFPPGL